MEREQDVELKGTVYTTQLRIGEPLAYRLKNYADRIGASVNSTICVAVDAWLKDIGE